MPRSTSLQRTPSEIRRELRRLSWARRLIWLPLAALVGLGVTLPKGLSWGAEEPVPRVVVHYGIAAAVCVVMVIVLSVRIGMTRCPRCGDPFHRRMRPARGVVEDDFARCCLNCGLRLDGSNADERLSDQSRQSGW